MKGILPIIKRNSGCDYHRIIQPLKYLGIDTDSLSRLSTPEMLKETKLVFFNRDSNDDIERVLKFKQLYGFKIVQDLDDYWDLNVQHPMYSTWVKNKLGEKIFKWIQAADAITVTTARLADKVRPFNKNVHIIPNGLPFGEEQFTDTRTESLWGTRFIYAGADSHVRDVDLLKIPFIKLRQQNTVPDDEFILAGYNPHNIPVWTKMQKVFDVMNNHKIIVTKPFNQYMEVYEQADVSIVPLEFNTFTPFKSNLKILEAGCKNIPTICSSVPPYSDEPDKSKVMYASNVREWMHWIKYCSKNKQFVKEKGLELGEYVRKNYDLRKINEHRKQLFESLIN